MKGKEKSDVIGGFILHGRAYGDARIYWDESFDYRRLDLIVDFWILYSKMLRSYIYISRYYIIEGHILNRSLTPFFLSFVPF